MNFNNRSASSRLSGKWVIANGQVTGKHPGVVLRSATYRP
jgi:hypothetical protein